MMLKKFKRARVQDVVFYMKSGNSIVVDNMSVDMTFQYKGNTVVGVSDVIQYNPKNRMLTGCLDLSQIEFVVVSKPRYIWYWE